MKASDHPSLRAPRTTNGVLVRLAYARAKAAGVNLAPILKKTHLTVHQVEDPGARLDAGDQIMFANLVADALNDNLFGFHLVLTADPREIGWLYYVLASSETMGEAFQRGVRYSAVVNEAISLQYIENAQAILRIRYVGVGRHRDQHQIESVATFLVRLCRQLTGARVTPSRVCFAHPRQTIPSAFSEFFGCNVDFGAFQDEIVFPAGITNKPVVSADPYLNKLLISQLDEALSQRRTSRAAFRSSVENAIGPLLPHGRARAHEVARSLGVSLRTLARRLSLEGLTFSDVLDELRTDLAKRHLADKDLSISEIAWLLGYQEISSFTHAFRRWTGKTPRDARSRAG